MQLILLSADKGNPLTKRHVGEAAAIVIQSLSEERRKKLPFRNGVLGRRWVGSFTKRYHAKLHYAVPEKQEAKRFRVVNAETLATHFANLNALVDEYGFDSDRFWNLDETGVTFERECTGSDRTKR